MASCSQCNSTILFGGKVDGEYVFCSDKCFANRGALLAARAIPHEIVQAQAEMIHKGPCPHCKGPGPVDIHTSHEIWSALILTQWKSINHVACRSCGVKKQLSSTLISGVVGWWGFPWGLIMTPVQLIKNLGGMVSGPDPSRPSPELVQAVRKLMGTRMQ